MKIKRVVVGNLEENCYILEKNNEVIVIDPGDEFEKIKKEIGSKKVLKVLITHKHFDHIGAISDIIKLYKVKSMDYNTLEEKEYNISSFKFRVISTPGHSDDSVSYYFFEDNVMFVGDFVFENNIGRCDLKTGDFSKMKMSISKLKKYSDDTILYPGHGNSTNIGREKMFNPYF